MKKTSILAICAIILCMTGTGCSPKSTPAENAPETQSAEAAAETETPAEEAKAEGEIKADENAEKSADADKAATPKKAAEPEAHKADADNTDIPKSFDDEKSVIDWTEKLMASNRYDDALRIALEGERQFGSSEALENAYQKVLDQHPDLHADPRHLTPGQDLTSMKRLGGGSSLVYKFTKDKENIAAFKPFQKRFQSNYRSEIAAYRLCPAMKCGFDIPTNLPVYFEYDEFSKLYARNSANPKDEFAEIIPSKMPDGSVRVDGTSKAWIPDYADFPIEIKTIWMPWLNPGTDRDALKAPVSDVLPTIAQKHKAGEKFVKKLEPHVAGLSKYELARQISNLIVFDYLMNNWDRFSGSPSLYGVNCQIVHGRFMSIDNGAAFAKTPNEKPNKHLQEISRFSRLTYEAIQRFDKEKMLDYLFPNATDFEKEKFETFWKQRQNYLDYVQSRIQKNGETETFFFE